MIDLPSFANRSPDYRYTINLAGTIYSIRMVWNVRCEYWFLTVVDQFGGRVDGVKVVPNWPLLTLHRAQIKMSGDLIALPLGNAPEIAYDGLGGKTHKLVYLTADELIAWESSNGMG